MSGDAWLFIVSLPVAAIVTGIVIWVAMLPASGGHKEAQEEGNPVVGQRGWETNHGRMR